MSHLLRQTAGEAIQRQLLDPATTRAIDDLHLAHQLYNRMSSYALTLPNISSFPEANLALMGLWPTVDDSLSNLGIDSQAWSNNQDMISSLMFGPNVGSISSSYNLQGQLQVARYIQHLASIANEARPEQPVAVTSNSAISNRSDGLNCVLHAQLLQSLLFNTDERIAPEELPGTIALEAPGDDLIDVLTSPNSHKKRRKKDKDAPKRPMSAYNLFFKDKRAEILNNITTPKTPKAESNDSSYEELSSKSASARNKRKTVHQRKGRNIPHHKVGFQELAQRIGGKWRNISDEEKEAYQSRADKEKSSYQGALISYHKSKENET